MADNNKENNIEARYLPVEPIDPDKYSVQQYLFDTNSLLTQVEKDLRILIELILDKKEKENTEEKKFKTIGISDD